VRGGGGLNRAGRWMRSIILRCERLDSVDFIRFASRNPAEVDEIDNFAARFAFSGRGAARPVCETAGRRFETHIDSYRHCRFLIELIHFGPARTRGGSLRCAVVARDRSHLLPPMPLPTVTNVTDSAKNARKGYIFSIYWIKTLIIPTDVT
jgi:hypothetical protein